jgi:hypothetical protein
MPSVGNFAKMLDPIKVASPEPGKTSKVKMLVAVVSFSFGNRSAISELADGDKVDSPTPTPCEPRKIENSCQCQHKGLSLPTQ